jgi:putative flippase GtrA
MKSACGDGRPREPALSEVEGSKPSEARQTLLRWIKFNAVGGIGIVVQLAAQAIFRSWMKLDYLLATALAVEIAVIQNFFWHERFTWADRPAPRQVQSLVRLVKFNGSNGAVSVVGNLVLMGLLVGELKVNYVAANLIAIVLCSLVNFSLGDRFVFEAEENSASISTYVVCGDRGFWRWPLGYFWGLRRDQSRDILLVAAMRSNGYISPLQTCWIEGRACPRRYLSVLPSHVRANLFGSD